MSARSFFTGAGHVASGLVEVFGFARDIMSARKRGVSYAELRSSLRIGGPTAEARAKAREEAEARWTP